MKKNPLRSMRLPDDGIVRQPANSADPLFVCIGTLEERVHEQGWDVGPSMWVIPGHPENPDTALPLPVDDVIWATYRGEPLMALEGIARAVASGGVLPPNWPVTALGVPVPLAGIAMVCEANGVFSSASDLVQPERSSQRRASRRKSETRRDGRLLFASMVDGRDLFLCRVRDHYPIMTVLRDDEIEAERAEHGTTNGGLRELLEAIEVVYIRRGLL